jgi:hypothetical protein
MAEIELRFVEAQRFTLGEGDKLLLRVPDDMADDAEQIAQQVAAQFPGHQLLVLCGGIELEIVSEQATVSGG